MLIFRVAIYAAGDMQPTRLPNNRHNDAQLVAEEFRRRHGAQGRVFAAPGRVNLIGEHTDYNDGFVMPAAIGFYTYIAADARDDDRLDIYSIDFRENREFILDGLAPSPSRSWSDYVCGVAAVMRLRGIPIRGGNLVLKGNVPIGAG